jgi:hypothetical protein
MANFPSLPACCVLALSLLVACRPADAPREPADPAEPTVSQAPDKGGGMHATVSRRAQVLARL